MYIKWLQQKCLYDGKQNAHKDISGVSAGLMHQPNVSPNANKPMKKNEKYTKEHDNSKQNVY